MTEKRIPKEISVELSYVAVLKVIAGYLEDEGQSHMAQELNWAINSYSFLIEKYADLKYDKKGETRE